ncbi:MAG: TonB family protein [Tannerellaceae bacterium]|jgi:TonB family protein|nr:TonB family protein [Tannerellaceae bacterium]
MSPLIVYFLKANLAFAFLYIVYWTLFRKDTFFTLKRVFLLMIFLLATVFPLIDVGVWMSTNMSMVNMNIHEVVMPDIVVSSGKGQGDGGIFLRWIYGFYVLGAGILFLRFVVRLVSIIRLLVGSKCTRIDGGKKVYLPANCAGAFSFFRLIFLSKASLDGAEREEIIAHEQVHALQFHSVDVMIGELMCILFWANPFVWLLRLEVRVNLEYLADRGVLKSGFDRKGYQYHLIGFAAKNQAAAYLYNNFNVLLLKKRIMMINKKRSRSIARTKYLILIPSVVFLAVLNNSSASSLSLPADEFVSKAVVVAEPVLPQDKKKTVYSVVDEMPEFPGGDMAMMKFLQNTIRYPSKAVEQKKEGRVLVQFVVNEDGSLSDQQILNSLSPELDEEALRVVRLMPQWTPGKLTGKAASVKYTLPVMFRLTKDKTVMTDNKTLVIIDGVEGDMTKIKPEEIDNITVLKDEAGKEKYGERGAHGVILVTTKKAK